MSVIGAVLRALGVAHEPGGAEAAEHAAAVRANVAAGACVVEEAEAAIRGWDEAKRAGVGDLLRPAPTGPTYDGLYGPGKG